MSLLRLKNRVQSVSIIGNAVLDNHKLAFHKISKKDGSGKCDVVKSELDSVLGVLFSIEASELNTLDEYEGNGYGYNREIVNVRNESGEIIEAATYRATNIDPTLRPYTWYIHHILEGAKNAELPGEYIKMIDSVETIKDPDSDREASELEIYSQ